jgi:hypothetical protein
LLNPVEVAVWCSLRLSIYTADIEEENDDDVNCKCAHAEEIVRNERLGLKRLLEYGNKKVKRVNEWPLEKNIKNEREFDVSASRSKSVRINTWTRAGQTTRPGTSA